VRESQYIDDYLDTAAEPGTRWTPHTFLSYTLRGQAKNWSSGYHRALMRAIERRVSAGTVIAVTSKGRSTAYIRAAVAGPGTPAPESGWASLPDLAAVLQAQQPEQQPERQLERL
jgi:hypothetical protein